MLRLQPARHEELIVEVFANEFAARSDNSRRAARFKDYARKWRSLLDHAIMSGDTQHSNFQVPFTTSQIMAKLSREYTAIFGKDAEITAAPVGPADHRIVHKVARFMNWRVLESMRMRLPACEFLVNKILYGRAHAYLGWEVDEYDVLDPQTGELRKEVWKEGPSFSPIRPGELIFPSFQWARTLHEFPWLIHRRFPNWEDLLAEERRGFLYDITKDREKIQQQIALGPDQSEEHDDITEEFERAEGVTYNSLEPVKVLEMWDYYTRMDIGRGITEDVVIKVIPSMRAIYGIVPLLDVYPTKRYRRPFVEAAMVRDGTYWSMGFGEMLASIQDELDANDKLFADAGPRSVDPGGFYRPADGALSEPFQIEPGTWYPVADPSGVRPNTSHFNPQYSILRNQELYAMGERVTGQSDLALGRTIDRPNAPRTATGQMAMMQAGDQRGELELILFSEDMATIVGEIWQLEQSLGNPETFFRVTEEEAGGLFDVAGGFSQLTAEERGSRYDFVLRFAPNYWEREQQKERTLMRYQLDLQNPLVVQSPHALWKITAEVHAALGDPNFGDLVPEPPDMGTPKKPQEEWTMLLQGEDVMVNPLDNDQLHIMEHTAQLDRYMQFAQRRDEPAMNRMFEHIREHRASLRQKQLMMAMAQDLAKQTLGNTITGKGLDPSILEGLAHQGGEDAPQ